MMAEYSFPVILNRHAVRAAAALSAAFLCSLCLCGTAFCSASADISEDALSKSTLHMEDQRCRTT